MQKFTIRRLVQFLGITGISLVLWLLPASGTAQVKKAPPPLRTTGPGGAGGQKAPVVECLNLIIQDPGRELMDAGPDTGSIDFNLEWTSCQAHRAGDYSPLEFLLIGSIEAEFGNIWQLTASLPQPGSPPHLNFIEDAMGRAGPAYGTDIPLTWEISLDGAPFTPMNIQPDNTITTLFPPGPHTFQVRITGVPAGYQADGYYKLQLQQCIIPEL